MKMEEKSNEIPSSIFIIFTPLCISTAKNKFKMDMKAIRNQLESGHIKKKVQKCFIYNLFANKQFKITISFSLFWSFFFFIFVTKLTSSTKLSADDADRLKQLIGVNFFFFSIWTRLTTPLHSLSLFAYIFGHYKNFLSTTSYPENHTSTILSTPSTM